MTPRTLFKVVIRSVGLVLVAMALPKLPVVWTQMSEIRRIRELVEEGYVQQISPEIYQPLGEVLIRLALGVYLLFFGRWLLNLGGAPRGACGECGYILAGLPAGGTCPECGAPSESTG